MLHRNRLILSAFIAPLAITACDGSRSSPTAPSASATLSASANAASPSLSRSSSRRQGELRLAKNCKDYSGLAGGFCTITASNNKWIPVGTKIVYARALAGTTLNSDITLYPPEKGRSVAFGHVVLDLTAPAPQGMVTLSGGTGRFAQFRGRADITDLGMRNWAWVGTYSFSEGEEDDDREH